MRIRISGIVNDSIVDGPGIRLTVFAQGCKHNCFNCHNPQTHDLNGGYFIEADEIINMIKKNPLLDGVTFSGGEPFLQAEAFTYLAQSVREMNLNLNIMAYTGYTWEELINIIPFTSLLKETDFIVDGKYVQELKTLDEPFVGSSNQRVIDVKKSFKEGSVILAL